MKGGRREGVRREGGRSLKGGWREGEADGRKE
jgi:hypothetical protein